MVDWSTADAVTECEIHSRSKDVGSSTATWFAELLSPNPWFKDVVPNVSILIIRINSIEWN